MKCHDTTAEEFEKNKESFQQHCSYPYSFNDYTCKACCKPFKTPLSIQLHVKQEHELTLKKYFMQYVMKRTFHLKELDQLGIIQYFT